MVNQSKGNTEGIAVEPEHTHGTGPNQHTHQQDKESKASTRPKSKLSPSTFMAPTVEEILGVEIDVNEFRVPSKDTQGHSARYWGNMQPGHAVEITEIVKSHRWPYRSDADVVRHAISRHLRWLQLLYPIPSVTGQVDAIMEVVREDEFMNDFQQVFSKTAESVGRHIAAGEAGMAKTMLSRIEQHISDMPDGDWRDKYMREFKQRFAGYLA